MSQIDGTFENDDIKNDTTGTAKSERDIQAKQDPDLIDDVAREDGVDADKVDVLPGTGGPDDVGDVDVDPSELNLSGDSIPGHPKPDAGS